MDLFWGYSPWGFLQGDFVKLSNANTETIIERSKNQPPGEWKSGEQSLASSLGLLLLPGLDLEDLNHRQRNCLCQFQIARFHQVGVCQPALFHSQYLEYNGNVDLQEASQLKWATLHLAEMNRKKNHTSISTGDSCYCHQYQRHISYLYLLILQLHHQTLNCFSV